MDDVERAQVYDHAYDHTKWPDHIQRVERTIEIATAFGADRRWVVGADLSCGDGAILRALYRNGTIQSAILGDLVAAEHVSKAYVGPIERTIVNLGKVDLFVCSETIEHLVDPDTVLKEIATHTRNLVLSTPILEEPERHANPEHYWSWDVNDVLEMLTAAGWTEADYDVLHTRWYDYQIWTATR